MKESFRPASTGTKSLRRYLLMAASSGSSDPADARGEPADVVCGYVNAKNAMGGYVGFKPFVYVYGQLHAMAGDEINNFVTSAMLKNLCRGMI